VQDHSTDVGSRGEGSGGPVAAPAPIQAGLLPAGARVLGGIIAWLFGATAGIGALLYALGYLATQANLHMLGLDQLDLRYDPTFYTQRGFEFLQLSARRVGGVWFWVFVVLALILLACPILYDLALFFRVGRFLHERGQRLATKQPFRSVAEHKEVFKKLLLYPGLLALLYLRLQGHLFIPGELNISGVLYLTSGTPGTFEQWQLFSGQEESRQEQFAEFVNQQFLIGLLLLVCWRLTRAWRWRAMATAPFAVVFAISATFLPLEYGTLVLPNKFAQVLIRFENPAAVAAVPQGMMYLLNKTDAEFVLWDPRRQRVVWIPNRTIASADISESRTLSQILESSKGAER
jgi:hypothetical protein